MASSGSSKRLTLSYALDWIIIICIAAVGAGFWKVTPNHRPFSPVDPNISFPYVEHEKISTGVLLLISLIIPAVITSLVALIFTPGLDSAGSRSVLWKRKLWEWNTAWLGLALALATTFFFTEGLKNLIGKPRPDLLSRCDLDPTTIQDYALGGDGVQLPLWNLLVSSTACRQPSLSKLNDGFASFPSGHSSFSWAGMLYLALYLCAKFSIAIPYLLPYPQTLSHVAGRSMAETEKASVQDSLEGSGSSLYLASRSAAAPPVYLLLLPLIPISIASYVASTRFSDFRHHGFDILFGSLLGSLLSYLSFRIYHMPIRRGAGFSWGPRSISRAWGIGMGVGSYVDTQAFAKASDLEVGNGMNRGPEPSSSS